MSKLDHPRPAAQARAALDAARGVLEAEPAVRWALAFGSAARGEDLRDVDLAVCLRPGALRGVAFGGLISRLESATCGAVDLVDSTRPPCPFAPLPSGQAPSSWIASPSSGGCGRSRSRAAGSTSARGSRSRIV